MVGRWISFWDGLLWEANIQFSPLVLAHEMLPIFSSSNSSAFPRFTCRGGLASLISVEHPPSCRSDDIGMTLARVDSQKKTGWVFNSSAKTQIICYFVVIVLPSGHEACQPHLNMAVLLTLVRSKQQNNMFGNQAGREKQGLAVQNLEARQ